MEQNEQESASVIGVVDRPRLYRVLDAESIRACVVLAPSGSGKTTLVRSWLRRPQRAATTLWVSLGGEVGSRIAFWQRVASTAARLGQLSEAHSTRVLDQLSASADPVRIARALIAEAGRFVLVLDAYEHLGDLREAIDEDLKELLRTTPKLRLIVTTRTPTHLSELELSGESIVRTVTLSELAFTSEEVSELVRVQARIDDDQLADTIVRTTHGFALTVRAVALAIAQLGRIPLMGSTEWDSVITARLESLLPDRVAVEFVVATSVPPYVDVQLASQLTNKPTRITTPRPARTQRVRPVGPVCAGPAGVPIRRDLSEHVPFARDEPRRSVSRVVHAHCSLVAREP